MYKEKESKSDLKLYFCQTKNLCKNTQNRYIARPLFIINSSTGLLTMHKHTYSMLSADKWSGTSNLQSMIMVNVSLSVPPTKGFRPTSNMYRITPRLQTSARKPTATQWSSFSHWHTENALISPSVLASSIDDIFIFWQEKFFQSDR